MKLMRGASAAESSARHGREITSVKVIQCQ